MNSTVQSPISKSRGENRQWSTSGPFRYTTPSVLGVQYASPLGGKFEVALKWADWLHSVCCFGGSPTPHNGGRNPQRPTNGQIGYMTPGVWGCLSVPNISVRGTKRAMARNRADWRHNPCRLRAHQGFTTEDKITISPQKGRLATCISPTVWGPEHFTSGKGINPISG